MGLDLGLSMGQLRETTRSHDNSFQTYDLKKRLFKGDCVENIFLETGFDVEHLDVDQGPALRSHDLTVQFSRQHW